MKDKFNLRKYDIIEEILGISFFEILVYNIL
jgi:hypothetical protein